MSGLEGPQLTPGRVAGILALWVVRSARDALWPHGRGLDAIGTLALAGVTVAAIVVTSVIAATDRRRDDRLRRKDTCERDSREAAERRTREDYEARQVVVRLQKFRDPAESYEGDAFTHRITVSTPHAYPIKWVDGRWVVNSSGNLSVVPFGFRLDNPTVDEDRTYYSFRARIPATAHDAEPIVRFVDWHGNQYYQYRHYTERFSQDTDFQQAAIKIDEWTRTGPDAD